MSNMYVRFVSVKVRLIRANIRRGLSLHELGTYVRLGPVSPIAVGPTEGRPVGVGGEGTLRCNIIKRSHEYGS